MRRPLLALLLAVSTLSCRRPPAADPAYAAEVDLGEKGTWFRVMVGEFETLEEASSFRQTLAEKGTPGMGFVYRVTGGS